MCVRICVYEKKDVTLQRKVWAEREPCLRNHLTNIITPMKKIFSLMAMALLSIAMYAGANDLLWDYTEGAPTDNPDKGLTYGSKVTDGPGVKNGLYGIKMNGSGYCYFQKAAVKGTLKLSFGPRSGNNATSLDVYTWAGETPAAETLIATTAQLTEYGTVQVDLEAEHTNIYIKRNGSVETVLQKLQFIEHVPRTFVDFKIEFRDDPYTVLLPEGGTLPEGVTITGTTYNGGQHGVQGGTITVPVDGTVKFTVGACQYSNTSITVKKDGVEYATFSNNAPCGETAGNFAQNVPYYYMGEAGTLTFEFGEQTYVPYFFAEAAEIIPCEITYKDQNGAVLGKVEAFEGATIEKIPYSETDLPTFPDSQAFRGWYYSNGQKAKVGDVVKGNTTIIAKVTPIEYATLGSVQTYNFASNIFYPEDHETITTTNGAFHDGTHGWQFKADGTIDFDVAGNAMIVVSACKYSETGDILLKKGDTEYFRAPVVKNETEDGHEFNFQYEGEAATLTLAFTSSQYIHKVTVYNVLDFPEKDESVGYYIVPAGDVASFLLVLVQANAEGDAKIFLPNGTYDLGETVLTTISGNNISIIGQSMDSTIILNAPDVSMESINNTATLKINKNVSGTYLQDLTIQNALDYYKNDNGRAVCLWDQGTKTVCKNVKLLSYQDTYYSNLQGAVKYFEDCEIHGTVDFICGDGSVYFNRNLLYAEKRKAAGGGSDALTANNGPATDRGYVFESCTVKSECPVVSLGRAWNNTPTTTFLNTIIDYSAGEFSLSDDNGIQRWTKNLMNKGAWPQFGEYNTHLIDGTVLTPASNVVTFKDEKDNNATKDIETVLTAEEAAKYTMAYTLAGWAETAVADARQVEAEKEAAALEADAVYLAETEGKFVMLLKGSEFMDKLALYDGKTYTLRKANARGGFGPKAGESGKDGLDEIQSKYGQSTKIIRDGHLLILRNDKTYNAQGAIMK